MDFRTWRVSKDKLSLDSKLRSDSGEIQREVSLWLSSLDDAYALIAISACNPRGIAYFKNDRLSQEQQASTSFDRNRQQNGKSDYFTCTLQKNKDTAGSTASK